MSIFGDIQLTCFVCLRTESDEYYSIFDSDLRTPNLTVLEKIKCCIEITVCPEENDKIPNKICSRCLDDLTATWRFKKNCLRANKIFSTLTPQYVESDKDADCPFSEISPSLKVARIQQCDKIEISKSTTEANSDVLSDVILDAESQDEDEIEHSLDIENFADFYETEEIFEEDINDGSPVFQEHVSEISKTGSEFLINANEECDNRRRRSRFKKENSIKEKSTKRRTFDNSEVPTKDANAVEIETLENNEPNDVYHTSSDADQPYTTKSVKRGKRHSAPKICDICGNSYKYQHTLNAHMRRHMNDRPFPCEFCDKSFVSGVEMHRHMRVHTGHKPYSCQHCERKFSDFGSRVKHERTHTGERPYSCPTCGKTFAYAHVLTVHLRTHTGEKKFQCTQCNKGFTKKVYLLAHIEQHARSSALNERNEHLTHLKGDLKTVELEECIITEYIDNEELKNEELVKLEAADESMSEDTETECKYIIKVQ